MQCFMESPVERCWHVVVTVERSKQYTICEIISCITKSHSMRASKIRLQNSSCENHKRALRRWLPSNEKHAVVVAD